MGILLGIKRRLFAAATDRLNHWRRDHGLARPDRDVTGNAPSPPEDARVPISVPTFDPPLQVDERTIRRMGEAELGGMSSEESRAAYESGENPGGLHHGGKGPAPRHGTEE